MSTPKKIPKRLQSILWSQGVKTLDANRDRNAIILKVLAYGSMADLRWLFHTYSKTTIVRAFYTHPQRLFSPASLRFVTQILLRSRKPVYESRYLKNLS